LGGGVARNRHLATCFADVEPAHVADRFLQAAETAPLGVFDGGFDRSDKLKRLIDVFIQDSFPFFRQPGRASA
jgi:hypothetical protein